MKVFTIYIVHTVLTAEVIKHPLPFEISIDLACAITITYEIYKFAWPYHPYVIIFLHETLQL